MIADDTVMQCPQGRNALVLTPARVDESCQGEEHAADAIRRVTHQVHSEPC